MVDLAIRGGLVATPDGPLAADVLVTGGRIERVGSGGAAAVEVDASGLWVLPGAIDAHVHGRDPGQTEKEDFASLTRAAAAGGVTTVVDMPNTIPAVDTASVLEAKAAGVGRRAVVDFALWGLIRSGATAAGAAGLTAAGAVGLKAYLGYSFRRSNRQVVYTPEIGPDLEAAPGYGTIACLAPELAAAGVLVSAHAEDPDVLRAAARPVSAYADLLASRPPVAEAVACAALGEIARETGLTVRIVHLSSAAGLEAALSALDRGARLQLETCPQFLWLTAGDFERLGNAMKMLPPVRQASDRDALRAALEGGRIGSIATDHAPHTDREKFGRSLEEASPGSPGIQSLYVSALELAGRAGDPWRAVEWVASGPARELRLAPRKGLLTPGADADLVLVDPGGETVVTAASMLSRQTRGAMDGFRAAFAISSVWSRGEPVARDGTVTGRPGRGRWLTPGPLTPV